MNGFAARSMKISLDNLYTDTVEKTKSQGSLSDEKSIQAVKEAVPGRLFNRGSEGLPMQLTDAHAHLNSEPLNRCVHDAIQRARAAGVVRIVNICMNSEDLDAGFQLHAKYPWIQNAAAVHPSDAARMFKGVFLQVAEAARAKKLVAIGETGLDYYRGQETKAEQIESLISHLHLAAETRLPAMFHCRDAFADLFAVADAEYPKSAPAILHCFTGTPDDAEQALARDWYISFSGVLTFKKNFQLHEIARDTPLDRILIETDSPYLAPQSHRGKVNEPAFVQEIACFLADLKRISPEEAALATSNNAQRLFGSSSP